MCQRDCDLCGRADGVLSRRRAHGAGGRSSGVEHNLAKVGVVGSNPIARSSARPACLAIRRETPAARRGEIRNARNIDRNSYPPNATPPVTALVTHRGGCHCGAVRFSCEAPAEIEVQHCNCSICRMTVYRHLVVPKSRFNLLSGADTLTSYRFGTGVAEHLFCAVCGVKSFYSPRSAPDSYRTDMTVSAGFIQRQRALPRSGHRDGHDGGRVGWRQLGPRRPGPRAAKVPSNGDVSGGRAVSKSSCACARYRRSTRRSRRSLRPRLSR